MSKMYSLVTDFDRTVADTFQPSPRGIGVEEAYREAVKTLFGAPGEDSFLKVGGLRNRAPGELMAALSNEGGLDLSPQEVEEAPERLVRAKMDILLQEINTTWPLPCAGFPELCRSLLQLRDQEGIAIALAIISSGHTTFIKRTLAVWESQWPVIHPDVIVSDDDLRHRNLPLKEKVKPSPFLFRLVEEGLGPRFSLKRTIFFGDDRNKDGQLAKNVGVPFGWFTPGTVFQGIEKGFRFSHWRVVANHLEDPKTIAQMRRGDPLRTILGL